MNEIIKIADFILQSFVHIWPYLLVSVPLAVLVQMSGASKYITKITNKNVYVSILLATIVGAVSPFCSCGVIPVVASMLIGGVPLAPVMSFWIASPSMDPEIFMLSVSSVGFNLSVWRLVATFVISLSAGLVTHFCLKAGIIDPVILKTKPNRKSTNPIKTSISAGKNYLRNIYPQKNETSPVKIAGYKLQPVKECCQPTTCCAAIDTIPESLSVENKCGCEKSDNDEMKKTFSRQLAAETAKAVWMVAKFMGLAFFINALIHFYIPQQYLLEFIKTDSPFAIITATLIGIPFYTSNLTALPLVSGLLQLGLNHGAALAFLIAGPVTTIPAMAAVYGLVKKRIFVLYLLYSLLGAIIFGLLFNLIN